MGSVNDPLCPSHTIPPNNKIIYHLPVISMHAMVCGALCTYLGTSVVVVPFFPLTMKMTSEMKMLIFLMVGSDRMEGASYFVEVDEMKVLNSRQSLLGDKTRH